MNSGFQADSSTSGSILFGFKETDRIKVKLASHPSLGYFAFDNSTSSTFHEPSFPTLGTSSRNLPPLLQDLDVDPELLRRQESRAKEREARLELERAEALRNEEAWVESGGVLRDEIGRKDMVRTLAIREELRRRKEEKHLRQRWENYEQSWNNLHERIQLDKTPWIRFCDVPWPVEVVDAKAKKRATELDDLVWKGIEAFLLDGLQVRGCPVTRKERIRASLLRWHPDKISFLPCVIEEDAERVKTGISIVVRCLQQLNQSNP